MELLTVTLGLAGAFIIAKLIVIMLPAILATAGAGGTGLTAWAFATQLPGDIALIMAAMQVAACLFLLIMASNFWRQVGVDLGLVGRPRKRRRTRR